MVLERGQIFRELKLAPGPAPDRTYAANCYPPPVKPADVGLPDHAQPTANLRMMGGVLCQLWLFDDRGEWRPVQSD